jgi:hypothetical protein
MRFVIILMVRSVTTVFPILDSPADALPSSKFPPRTESFWRDCCRIRCASSSLSGDACVGAMAKRVAAVWKVVQNRNENAMRVNVSRVDKITSSPYVADLFIPIPRRNSLKYPAMPKEANVVAASVPRRHLTVNVNGNSLNSFHSLLHVLTTFR